MVGEGRPTHGLAANAKAEPVSATEVVGGRARRDHDGGALERSALMALRYHSRGTNSPRLASAERMICKPSAT